MAATLIIGDPSYIVSARDSKTLRASPVPADKCLTYNELRRHVGRLFTSRHQRDQPILQDRAAQHETGESRKRPPGLRMRQRLVNRERNQAVDDLHVNPVHEQRRAAELL